MSDRNFAEDIRDYPRDPECVEVEVGHVEWTAGSRVVG